MELPITLQNKIADFLKSLPNMEGENNQRAFISRVGLDEILQAQIPFGQPLSQFVQLLIPIVIKYGLLEDRRNALQAILEAARDIIGKDRKEYCDTLIQQIQNSLQLIATTTTNEKKQDRQPDRENRHINYYHFVTLVVVTVFILFLY